MGLVVPTWEKKTLKFVTFDLNYSYFLIMLIFTLLLI